MIVTPIEPPPRSESTIEFISSESTQEKELNKNVFQKEESFYSFANSAIAITRSIFNEIDVNLKASKENEYREKLLQIKRINFNSEEIEPPSEKVFQDAYFLIEKLINNNFFPDRISESAEGGLCFYFYQGSKGLYFEIYNNGEKGYIMEDISQKKIIKNYDISSYKELITELENFYL